MLLKKNRNMWTEEKLNDLMTTPSETLVEDVKKIKGDIMILGAGGKMGPTLAILAKKAIKKANINKRVIAVSRFSDSIARHVLESNDIEIIACDLMEEGVIDSLPDAENIIFMVGRKFGTVGDEILSWGMNTWLPVHVAKRFKKSNILAFSTGGVYGLAPVFDGGSIETDSISTTSGDYVMSAVGRERMFQYGAEKYGTKLFLYRLTYAVDLRYGVIYDIASSVINDKPISLKTSLFNCIWQGDANEIAIRGLLYADNPAVAMNITGPEAVSVKYVANIVGEMVGKTPTFVGEESIKSSIRNAGKSIETFGYPTVPVNTLIKWTVEWIQSGGRDLGKPTHFEEREGKY